MRDLDVLIASRNEPWLQNTIDDILSNIHVDTGIIVVLDGYWPKKPIPDNPRVTLVHHTVSIGQRAAVNEAARISQARYIFKSDAHCAFDTGFDAKLIGPYDSGKFDRTVTTIPRMYNLHVFNWLCLTCNKETYQGPTPEKCEDCKGTKFERKLIWKPRLHRRTDFGCFDNTLHFQYWGKYRRRPEARGYHADVMCCVGAGWMMARDRYWELGGMDENHGSWGQMGVEVACKSWLSGGRQIVNKRTWFSHLFRKGGDFGWPYPMEDGAIEKAREYSRDLWINNKWSKAVRPFSWILDHFKPVPWWHDGVTN